MVPVGSSPLRVGVFGTGSVEAALTDASSETDRSLSVESVDWPVDRRQTNGTANHHCVILDATATDRDLETVIERYKDKQPDVPLIVLANGDGGQQVDVLVAGADETLPVDIVDRNPPLLAEHIVETVERATARTGFRDFYEGLVGGVTLHDPESGEILSTNDRFCEMLDYSRDALQSESAETLTADVTEYDGQRARNAVRSASSGEAALRLEWPFEAADGSVRWTDSRLDTVQVGPRELVAWFSRDITERRRAEHRYERVFDGVNDVISIHDPWAEEMVEVNETLTDVTGYGREALLAMDVGGVSATEEGYTGERAYDIFKRVATTDESETVEWAIETAEGDRRQLESNIAPAQLAGEDRVLVLSRDVTERQQLERTYREVFENVSDGLVLHDPETGEIVDVNDRYCSITGYERDELVGANVRRIVPDDPEYTFEQAISRIRRAREEGPQLFEFKGQRKDGTTFTGEIHLTVVELRGTERVLASVRDVSERAQREQELDEQRRLYSTLVDQSPNGVMIVQDKEIQFVNPRMEGLTGRSESALLGAPFYQIMTDEYRTLVKERFEKRTRGEEPPQNYEVEIRTENDDSRIIDLHVSRIQYQGAPATLATFDDVTERRRQERELRQSERRFQLIAEHIDDIIYLATADFSEILYINDAYEEIYGRPLAELDENPTSFVEAAHPADRKRYQADVDRLQADVEAGDPEDAYEGQYRIRRDGELRWVSVTRFPVANEDGTVDRIVGRVADVTERIRREREYEQIFDGVNDAIVIQDPETAEPLDANQPFLDRLGYDDVEEIRAEGFDALSATDEGYTRARARELCQRVTRTGEPETVEWQQETRDGERRWIEAKVDSAVIQGEERILSMQRDVTERKRREREYERIFDGVNDGITVFEPETGAITDVNETYFEMLGYDDLETIQTLGIDGLSAAGDQYTGERGRELIREVSETGEPTTVEWRAATADNEELWLEVTLSPAEIRGEDRVLSIQRDITERKRREREYEQIFNGVHDVITVHDPETAELVDVNDTFCELLGYDRERILEMGIEGYTPADQDYSMDEARAFVRDVVESDEPKRTEWAVETRDGAIRWLEVKGTTVEIGGEERYVSIDRDVTEQRRTERRLTAILDRIDEAIFMTRAGEITEASQAPDYVSSGYDEIWGQPLDGIRDRYEDGFFGTLHPDDEAGYRSFVEGIVDDIREGQAADSYSREYRIERPDGEVRWVHSDFYPAAWESGPPRVVIVSRDVTDRKARERRIASFDDATDDLATADTPEEATRTAVEAATEELDLTAVGAFLYDGDDGVLQPEILTGPFPSTVAAEPIGPGDGPLWEGFATGTIVASDGGQAEPGFVGDGDETPAALSDLAEWRALALGNHGILLVGSPASTLDPETIQAAHVLAATLEAALNHLEGQERLAAQEEQLRTQTERADRLDRIARLTQRVEAAITDASSPGEIEQAVCERLAGSGPYGLAWVGGLEVGADQLAARSVVGASERYVGGLDLTTAAETADPHPAIAAWRHDEPHVADSLVGAGPAAEWRDHALSEGYQSLCAVPLTYDGVTHGVLTVGTDAPNAFSDRERDVLSQLGTSIANALAAVERRRALESDETVELEFSGTGESLSFARVADATDCRVTLERTVARQDGTVSVYFGFDGNVPDAAAETARELLPGEVEVVTDESAAPLVVAQTDDWFGSPLAEYGGVLREATATPGETTVTVEVPKQADVRSFVERLQTVAPSLELVARRQHRRQDHTPAELSDQVRTELTDRQFEVLRTALTAGYFEWPRENDGSDVADRLGITQPTLNKHLRIAEKKTFSLLFDAEA